MCIGKRNHVTSTNKHTLYIPLPIRKYNTIISRCINSTRAAQVQQQHTIHQVNNVKYEACSTASCVTHRRKHRTHVGDTENSRYELSESPALVR